MQPDPVPYENNPLWSDVIPIEQDDGPDPVVPIAYSAPYKSAMNYFRALVHKGEMSPRALDLTKQIISINPAHYTIWQYRQDILFHLNSPMEEEFDFLEKLVINFPKSYQIWHHRQILVSKSKNYSREKAFIAKSIEEDSKNYHAWSYRQWLIKEFNLWKGEIEYIQHLLNVDVRNNSAWNHRFFVITHTPGLKNIENIKSEISFTLPKIKLAPNNESAWNYLRGVIGEKKFTEFPEVERTCNELLESQVTSPHLYSLLVDINNEKGLSNKCAEYCTLLATKLDPIRKHFWEHKQSSILGDKSRPQLKL